MKFRRATENDLELLFQWRNDPETRTHSFNGALIKREDHERWFKATLSNQNCILFIVEENGVAVGTIRADTLNGEYELSWTVALEARGRGIGKRMLIQATQEMQGCVLRAKIKTDNIASLKMARSAGFIQESEENGVSEWIFRRSLKG